MPDKVWVTDRCIGLYRRIDWYRGMKVIDLAYVEDFDGLSRPIDNQASWIGIAINGTVYMGSGENRHVDPGDKIEFLYRNFPQRSH